MRDLEPGLVDRVVAVEEEIEVDRPRPPLRPDALAAEPALDVEQVVEQLPGRERRLQLGDGVQEPRLLRVAPRLGLANRRQARCADQLGRAADRGFAVSEVRTEPDVGERHGRSTVTAEYSTARSDGRFRTWRVRRSGANRTTIWSATAVASASRRS